MTTLNLASPVLIVELPEGATDFVLHYWRGRPQLTWATDPNGDNRDFQYLPPGSYTLLGTRDTMSEEEAASVVKNLWNKHFFDYMRPLESTYAPGFILDTALESFHSAIRAAGIDPASNWVALLQNPSKTKTT